MIMQGQPSIINVTIAINIFYVHLPFIEFQSYHLDYNISLQSNVTFVTNYLLQ